MKNILIAFVFGIWAGYGIKLATAHAILKISKAYSNLFIDYCELLYKIRKMNKSIRHLTKMRKYKLRLKDLGLDKS